MAARARVAPLRCIPPLEPLLRLELRLLPHCFLPTHADLGVVESEHGALLKALALAPSAIHLPVILRRIVAFVLPLAERARVLSGDAAEATRAPPTDVLFDPHHEEVVRALFKTEVGGAPRYAAARALNVGLVVEERWWWENGGGKERERGVKEDQEHG